MYSVIYAEMSSEVHARAYWGGSVINTFEMLRFLPRDAMPARCMPLSCVCLSHSGIVSKWLNAESRT